MFMHFLMSWFRTDRSVVGTFPRNFSTLFTCEHCKVGWVCCKKVWFENVLWKAVLLHVPTLWTSLWCDRGEECRVWVTCITAWSWVGASLGRGDPRWVVTERAHVPLHSVLAPLLAHNTETWDSLSEDSFQCEWSETAPDTSSPDPSQQWISSDETSLS